MCVSRIHLLTLSWRGAVVAWLFVSAGNYRPSCSRQYIILNEPFGITFPWKLLFDRRDRGERKSYQQKKMFLVRVEGSRTTIYFIVDDTESAKIALP